MNNHIEKMEKISNNKYSGSEYKEKMQYNDRLEFKDKLSRNKSQDLLSTKPKTNPNNQEDRS